MSVSSRIRMQVVRSVAPEAEGSASTSTASTSAKLGSHTTGVADSGRWSTRRIAMYALFVALAMVTSFIEFPITPVTWLKYDPSGIVCLIAGFCVWPGRRNRVCARLCAAHVRQSVGFADGCAGGAVPVCAGRVHLP